MATTPARIAPKRIAVVAAAIGVPAAAALLAIGLHRPASHSVAPVHRPIMRAVAKPLAPSPPVEPKLFAPVAPTDARTLNDRVPFATDEIEPAKPFKYVGGTIDRAAAQTCLAAAALYEAGDDADGEQAVAQVVLNRLRHPAFPKTVCGVVFEGAERHTGCQFTFACDGSLGRPPRDAAWDRARDIADRALSGHVDKDVGTATHYHADYVVPYWKASLDKLAAVGAQIFYRWHGSWGELAAFRAKPGGAEQLDPRLASFEGAPAILGGGLGSVDLANASGVALPSLSIPGVSHAALRGSIVRAMDVDANQYALELRGSADGYAQAARTICRDKPNCMVMGWLSADHVPLKLPVLPARLRSLAFLYRKNQFLAEAQTFWNCGQISRRDAGECLPGTAR